MNMQAEIMERVYSIVNMFNAEARQSRDYGTGHLLYDSEIHLIVTIFHHKDANVSELAQSLKVTNGAISQVANKLEKKGLIERYKVEANRKDTFYRLTEQGEKAFHGHENHHTEIQKEALKHIQTLDDDSIKVIITLLDKLLGKKTTL